MIGEVESYAVLKDGTRELFEKGNNLVVNSAYIAMAIAMKSGANKGFLYWAMGDGNTTDSAAWDAGVADGTIKPAKTDTKLARETFRKLIADADIEFVDSVGAVSASPTNRLRIKIIFEENEPGGPLNYLREWGIFGATATAAADSGYLVNRKVHATYEKTDVVQIERTLTFTF